MFDCACVYTYLYLSEREREVKTAKRRDRERDLVNTRWFTETRLNPGKAFHVCVDMMCHNIVPMETGACQEAGHHQLPWS